MKTIYFTLQAKGGVGKTLVSSYLMQYLQETQKIEIKGIDTDPNNRSFKSIKKIEVEALPLIDENQQINERNFDKMIETFFNHQETSFVIDNGATSFLPLLNYLVENDIINMLKDTFNIVINIPITGGEAQNDTLNGMKYIIDTFNSNENVTYNVWKNEFFGKIVEKKKPFEEMPQYEEYRETIHGLITLPQVNPATYGVDLRKMHKSKHTFQEVKDNPNYTLMEKQRIINYKNRLFESLATIMR